MIKCNTCQKLFKCSVTIDDKVRNLSKRKHCMDCLPFLSPRLGRSYKTSTINDKKKCPRCDKVLDPSCFYKRRDSSGYTCYCKNCLREQYWERYYEFKKKCVDYKGGQCQTCGYKKCLAALDFHHINPKEKDFVISRKKHRSDWSLIKKELDKCELLCANCHREEHDKRSL